MLQCVNTTISHFMKTRECENKNIKTHQFNLVFTFKIVMFVSYFRRSAHQLACVVKLMLVSYFSARHKAIAIEHYVNKNAKSNQKTNEGILSMK